MNQVINTEEPAQKNHRYSSVQQNLYISQTIKAVAALRGAVSWLAPPRGTWRSTHMKSSPLKYKKIPTCFAGIFSFLEQL